MSSAGLKVNEGQWETDGADETVALGRRIGRELAPGSIVCLFGELGSGKTSLVKGLAGEVACTCESQIHSPTYVYLNIYEGATCVYHFDLYRLRSADQFLELGFDEYFYEEGICCIEWSERIQSILPEGAITIHCEHAGGDRRRITLLA